MRRETKLAAQANYETGTEEKKRKLSNETSLFAFSLSASRCTDSGKACVFCNDASSTMASHFQANWLYKRHLDKKLDFIGSLQLQLFAEGLWGGPK
jgi:hypothetical protein